MTTSSDFEALAAQIYSELAPDATVTLDDRIRGSSGVERQIDVSIRAKVASHEILIVVDTKDLAIPADIGVVDEFSSKVRDVKANKGILICSSGFTAGATAAAIDRGVDLCNIHDAQNRKWRMELRIPVLWIDLRPAVRFHIIAEFAGGDNFPKDPALWVISRDRGKTRINLLSTFERLWNGREIPVETGRTHEVRPPVDGLELLIRDSDGRPAWRRVGQIVYEYEVLRTAYLGEFEPEECRGVFQYSEGRFIPSYLPIGSVPHKRDASWKQINDPEKLAIDTLGLLVTTEGWQVLPGSGRFNADEVILRPMNEGHQGSTPSG